MFDTNFNLRTEDDARLQGSLIALTHLLTEVIYRHPDRHDIIERMLTIGDRFETGKNSDVKLIRLMGASARETVERVGAMAEYLAQIRPAPRA